MCYDIELYALLLCVCVENLRGEMDDKRSVYPYVLLNFESIKYVIIRDKAGV